MRRFELSSGRSNKFWSAATEGSELVVAFGRIGTDGQTKRKAFAGAALAKAALANLVEEKLAKGYREVKGYRDVKAAARASPLVRAGHPELAKQIASLRSHIAKRGLATRSAALEAIARWSVRMVTKRAPRDPPLGASRIGGEPDLPPGMAWPAHKKQPMAFAAQIRLEAASPYDVDGLLPKRGLLSIFVEPYLEAVDVRYFEGRELGKLERRRIAEPTAVMGKAPANPCSVTFRTEYSLPPLAGPTMKALELDEAEQDRYIGLYEQHVPRAGAIHRLLGYPGWSSNFSQTRDVELLAQIGSDSLAGMSWGDAQPCFVFIARKALAARDFAKARLTIDG